MKPLAAIAALVLEPATAVPALARDSYVIDNAHLLSACRGRADQREGRRLQRAHPQGSLRRHRARRSTGTPQAAAERVMAQQQVNGVLIFVAKSPKTIGVVPDRAAARFFPSGTTAAIRQAIVSAFNAGNFDGGINNGVDLTLSQYRSHLPRARAPTRPMRRVAAPSRTPRFHRRFFHELDLVADRPGGDLLHHSRDLPRDGGSADVSAGLRRRPRLRRRSRATAPVTAAAAVSAAVDSSAACSAVSAARGSATNSSATAAGWAAKAAASTPGWIRARSKTPAAGRAMPAKPTWATRASASYGDRAAAIPAAGAAAVTPAAAAATVRRRRRRRRLVTLARRRPEGEAPLDREEERVEAQAGEREHREPAVGLRALGTRAACRSASRRRRHSR